MTGRNLKRTPVRVSGGRGVVGGRHGIAEVMLGDGLAGRDNYSRNVLLVTLGPPHLRVPSETTDEDKLREV